MSKNETDVVTELMPGASPDFSNWFNSEFKEEFIHDCHRIQMREFTPGLLRADLIIAFEAGRRAELQAQITDKIAELEGMLDD